MSVPNLSFIFHTKITLEFIHTLSVCDNRAIKRKRKKVLLECWSYFLTLNCHHCPRSRVSELAATSKNMSFTQSFPPNKTPEEMNLYSRIDDLVPNDVFILPTIVLGALVVSTMCVTRNYYYVEKERDKKYYPLMSPLPNSGDFDICEI